VDIEPLMDRMVIFSSHQVLHCVLPSWLPRYCVTLWFDGSLSPEHQLPGGFPWLSEQQDLQFLLHPENKKSLAKLIYAKEWERSIRLSFGEKQEVEEIVKKHRENVDQIRKKLGDKLVEFLVQHLPLTHADKFLEYAFPQASKNDY